LIEHSDNTATSQTIVLFPAFLLKYKGNEISCIDDTKLLYEKLKLMSSYTNIELQNFDIEHNNYLNKELENQLITYAFSCLYFDKIKNKLPHLFCLNSLSMGIYASLYAANSISFEHGAILITNIYKHLKKYYSEKEFCMLSVIGLNNHEILGVIEDNNLSCEIIIKNSTHSYVLIGDKFDIQFFIRKAQEIGALNQNIIHRGVPYHSKGLSQGLSSVKDIFKDIQLNDASIPIFSSLSLSFIEKQDDLKEEIINNLFTPIDWFAAINSLLIKTSNNTVFVECGPGNSIERILRFVDGNYSFKRFSYFL